MMVSISLAIAYLVSFSHHTQNSR